MNRDAGRPAPSPTAAVFQGQLLSPPRLLVSFRASTRPPSRFRPPTDRFPPSGCLRPSARRGAAPAPPPPAAQERPLSAVPAGPLTPPQPQRQALPNVPTTCSPTRLGRSAPVATATSATAAAAAVSARAAAPARDSPPPQRQERQPRLRGARHTALFCGGARLAAAPAHIRRGNGDTRERVAARAPVPPVLPPPLSGLHDLRGRRCPRQPATRRRIPAEYGGQRGGGGASAASWRGRRRWRYRRGGPSAPSRRGGEVGGSAGRHDRPARRRASPPHRASGRAVGGRSWRCAPRGAARWRADGLPGKGRWWHRQRPAMANPSRRCIRAV